MTAVAARPASKRPRHAVTTAGLLPAAAWVPFFPALLPAAAWVPFFPAPAISGAGVEDEPGHLPRVAGVPVNLVPAALIPPAASWVSCCTATDDSAVPGP
jgi:hypothetical protein